MPKRARVSKKAAPAIGKKLEQIATDGDDKTELLDDDQPPPTKIIPVLATPLIAKSSTIERLEKLNFTFFDQPCVDLSKALLGKVIVRKFSAADDNGNTSTAIVTGRIVETEAYGGGDDKASNSYNGRRSEANAAMYMAPGTAYVYMTYGMYNCFNISSKGDGAAVLIRAVEPLEGIEVMQSHRQSFRANRKTPQPPQQKALLKLTQLCNGPSKMCIALNILRDFNRLDMVTSDEFYVADDGYRVSEEEIVACPRIGINNRGEWTLKPLRFYISDSDYVSVKMKVPSKE